MKRLPTKAEFEALLKLPHKWDEERNGLVFTASNGNELFFPAYGYQHRMCIECVGRYGDYWSSTTYCMGYTMYFGFSSTVKLIDNVNNNYSISVRLVSDEPCDGYINMGTGVYWAPVNYQEGEKIYFTWDEAMAIKDKVNGTAGLLMKKDGNTPELNITDVLNWEQRRYDIAKAALAGLLANPSYSGTTNQPERAVKYADDMIKLLKQQDNEID